MTVPKTCPVCGAITYRKPSDRRITCGRSCGQRYWRQREGYVRRNSNGYIYTWNPEHPLALADGYLAEHRAVAWKHGILTNPEMHVHHKNGIKDDNRPENLEALWPSDHHSHHAHEDGVIENQHGVWPLTEGETCAIEGCGKPRATREWCNGHYIRWRRHGDPLGASKRKCPSCGVVLHGAGMPNHVRFKHPELLNEEAS